MYATHTRRNTHFVHIIHHLQIYNILINLNTRFTNVNKLAHRLRVRMRITIYTNSDKRFKFIIYMNSVYESKLNTHTSHVNLIHTYLLDEHYTHAQHIS